MKNPAALHSLERKPWLDRLLWWLCSPAFLLPAAAGPLFTVLPLFEVFLRPFLQRYFYLLSLVIVWQILRQVVLSISRSKESAPKAPKGSRLKVLLIVLLAFVIMAALQLLQLNLPLYSIYIALFALGSLGLSDAFIQKGQLIGASALQVFGSTAITYLSFLTIYEDFNLQPLLIGFAFGSIHAVLILGRGLSLRPNAGTTFQLEAKALITYALSAPLFVAILCYLDQLPRTYLALFGVVPLTAKLAEGLRGNQPISQLQIRRFSESIFIVYVAILIAISLLGRF